MLFTDTPYTRVTSGFCTEQLANAVFAINQRQCGQLWITLITEHTYFPMLCAFVVRKNGTCSTIPSLKCVFANGSLVALPAISEQFLVMTRKTRVTFYATLFLHPVIALDFDTALNALSSFCFTFVAKSPQSVVKTNTIRIAWCAIVFLYPMLTVRSYSGAYSGARYTILSVFLVNTSKARITYNAIT